MGAVFLADPFVRSVLRADFVLWGGLPVQLLPLGDICRGCLTVSVARRAHGATGTVSLVDPLVYAGIPAHLLPFGDRPRWSNGQHSAKSMWCSRCSLPRGPSRAWWPPRLWWFLFTSCHTAASPWTPARTAKAKAPSWIRTGTTVASLWARVAMTAATIGCRSAF